MHLQCIPESLQGITKAIAIHCRAINALQNHGKETLMHLQFIAELQQCNTNASAMHCKTMAKQT